MGRISPSTTAPKWQEPQVDKSFSVHLKLITPMFGGGYEPREVDPVCIIRSASIRGHLRFWWRALYGGQYSSAEELYREESKLWGAAAEDKPDSLGPGKVRVQVENVNWSQQKKTVNHRDLKPRNSPAKVGPEAQYLLYTFQKQKKEGTPEAQGYDGVSFVLRIMLDHSLSSEQCKQVENTIKAWIALGGIGARTRRGCGSLTVTQEQSRWLPPPDVNARREWFQQLLPRDVPAGPCRVSILPNALVVCGKSTNNAIHILHDLGRFWARFRKGHVGSMPYTPMSGSKWQDYRGALLKFGRQGGNAISLSKPYFGLPIVYQQFPKADYAPTIEAAETGRMASPVILKPMALANGEVCPLCVVLTVPLPRKVTIKPPDKTVDLTVPQNDRVLQELGVRHPLAAVVKAAEQEWNTKAFKLGGDAT